MCLSLHKQCTSLRSLLRVQERRRSPNFYSSSSNHCSFHKLGIFGPILMKLGANSTKFGVLRCLSLSSPSSRRHRGLQTWSLQPENKNSTLKAVYFMPENRSHFAAICCEEERDRFWICYPKDVGGLACGHRHHHTPPPDVVAPA